MHRLMILISFVAREWLRTGEQVMAILRGSKQRSKMREVVAKHRENWGARASDVKNHAKSLINCLY